MKIYATVEIALSQAQDELQACEHPPPLPREKADLRMLRIACRTADRNTGLKSNSTMISPLESAFTLPSGRESLL